VQKGQVVASPKSIQVIQPFPSDIDRFAFGNYLSGLTDGEGCFRLVYAKAGKHMIGTAMFKLKMRADDSTILSLIRQFFQCGTIYPVRKSKTRKINAQLEYSVHDIHSCHDIVLRHFTDYPLRAKKPTDFAIWAVGVRMLLAIKNRKHVKLSGKGVGKGAWLKRWTEDDRTAFQSLVAALRAQCVYHNQLALPFHD
jgi:hypothetical protein